MSKYKVAASSRFKRDVKRLTRRGYDIEILKGIVLQLADGKTLPPKNEDHPLKGKWAKYRECHVKPDWLLVYKVDNGTLTLVLSRTGTHSDVFDL